MNRRFTSSGCVAIACIALVALTTLTTTGCDEIGKGPNYGATGPGPSTQFSARLEKNLGPALTANAVRCDDTTIDSVKGAGAIYIGDLQVLAKPSRVNLTGSVASEIDVVNARAATEAANQGATHFTIASSDIQSGNPSFDHSGDLSIPSSTIHYAMYRLDPSLWGNIANELRPLPIVSDPQAPVTSPATPPTAPPSTPPADSAGETHL